MGNYIAIKIGLRYSTRGVYQFCNFAIWGPRVVRYMGGLSI